ncbi:MAG: hypothetical protein JXX14_17450 [Deltaproteobacteria bacterium]|nr:hypothetical protein [Deltaproteobacteria bacterium]
MTNYISNNGHNPYQTPNANDYSSATASPSAGYQMNGLWLTGLLVNAAVSLMAFVGYGMAMGAIISGFLVLCVVGTILILSGAPRVGKGLFIAGTIGFVPIGMIGLFGMRKAADAVVARDFWKGDR